MLTPRGGCSLQAPQLAARSCMAAVARDRLTRSGSIAPAALWPENTTHQQMEYVTKGAVLSCRRVKMLRVSPGVLSILDAEWQGREDAR